MAKIAFYIQFSNIEKTIKNKNFLDGNPGIGGTQYLNILTVLLLNRKFGSDYAVLLSDIEVYINDLKIQKIGNEKDAALYCKKNGIEVLVLNVTALDNKITFFEEIEIRYWIWCHNSISYKWQKIIKRTKNIEYAICVSEQQCKNMESSIIYDKVEFINNIICDQFCNNSIVSDLSNNIVVYVGSIYPQKGLDKALQIWNYVEQKHKDAKLYVFGGAKIWNSDIKVGKLGIADEFYDNILLKELKKIKNRENIVFWGPKSWSEINSLISNAKVGIVNPSNYKRDETFCMSAVELQAHGIPVISKQRGDGLNTTIKHEFSGYLEESNKKIAERICYLLDNNEKLQEMSQNALNYSHNFTSDNVIQKWNKLYQREVKKYLKRKKEVFYNMESFLLFMDNIRRKFYIIKSGKLKSKIFKK